MALSVSIRKKSEDSTEVIYFYGKLGKETGEFSINKKTHEVQKLGSTTEPIDQMMYLVSASKIKKLMLSKKALPETTSYNS
ncbi:hypothetical protein SH1V18_03920 [Vallitalea longa]|uniref:Uncharacterized protein n=1 Tax=Vallitalea longa TaxID=2936439 RepID=A0A9W5Y7J5_9FIRM|nr:hypothetical protein [Vallitalea longa]GKX27912.1 hypothetical protein SH1V18_03920 [Vallitalea longa]